MLNRTKFPLMAAVVAAAACSATLSLAQTEKANAPAAGAGPRFTIAMVLPRSQQNIEAGFTGYLQRQGVQVQYVPIRYDAKQEEETQLRARVRDAKPDLIYAWGTPTVLALAGKFEPASASKSAHDDFIRDIPIVFSEVTDPVGAGLIPSMEKPQRNVTGVSHVAPLQVQLNAIRAYRPFQKLGYVHTPNEPNSQLILTRLQELAREQKFEVVTTALPLLANGAPDDSQIAPAIASLAKNGADFLYVGPITYLAYNHRDTVTNAALTNKLPTFCATESIVRQSGCMFGLFSNGTNVGAYAGSMARQILVDKKPAASIAASTLQRFSLLVNMRTASELQLYPPLLLLNVAEVINTPTTAAR